MSKLIVNKETLEDKLDELFPKGQCQERSKALVLFAYAIMAIEQAEESSGSAIDVNKVVNERAKNIFLNWFSLEEWRMIESDILSKNLNAVQIKSKFDMRAIISNKIRSLLAKMEELE